MREVHNDHVRQRARGPIWQGAPAATATPPLELELLQPQHHLALRRFPPLDWCAALCGTEAFGLHRHLKLVHLPLRHLGGHRVHFALAAQKVGQALLQLGEASVQEDVAPVAAFISLPVGLHSALRRHRLVKPVAARPLATRLRVQVEVGGCHQPSAGLGDHHLLRPPRPELVQVGRRERNRADRGGGALLDREVSGQHRAVRFEA